MKGILITGINRGLGEAFFKHYMSNKDCLVIGVSRSINEEQKQLLQEGRFVFVQSDLAKLTDPEEELQLSKYFDGIDELIFINNAATVHPINKIGAYKNSDVRNILLLNTLAPVLMTNYVLKKAGHKKVTIVNISSGAAKKPIEGWSLYCASKAANEMFFSGLELQEKDNPNIRVLNINPGVIDSGMQEQIRNAEKSIFPRIQEFIKMKEEGKLATPTEVVKRIISENAII